MDIGVIIADIHISYEAPVLWGLPINVGVRTVKIGNKSITLEQCLTNRQTDKLYASGSVILVAYDYRRHETIPVPAEWREKATQFEGHSLNGTQESGNMRRYFHWLVCFWNLNVDGSR